MPSDGPLIVLTAFEPSGDNLGARMAEALRAKRPDLRFAGFGGPAMARAGVDLIEETTGKAVMLIAGAVAQAREHTRRVGVFKRWLAEQNPAALVPVDSPAANWAMCAAVRKRHASAKIVHLVGPQLWAWGGWRISKLRRLTDHVLCLLPFEPQWFQTRGVPATFVGHPLFEEALTPRDIDDLPGGTPRLALLPGSRAGEVKHNWPDLLEMFELLRHRHERLAVVVAAADRARAEQIERLSPGGRLPRRMSMVTGDAAAVLQWADAAVIVSGTATLEAVARRTPMVATFRVGKLAWNVAGRVLVQTRTFTLPNLLGESLGVGRVIPELVPHFGGGEPLLEALQPLLTLPAAADAQRAGFDAIRAAFAAARFADAAPDALLAVLGK
jgi:lipid-A-disaccharide synthase